MSEHHPHMPPDLPKNIKRKLGMKTPIDAIDELVENTIGDNAAGEVIKGVGAAVVTGALAVALGATGPAAAGSTSP